MTYRGYLRCTRTTRFDFVVTTRKTQSTVSGQIVLNLIVKTRSAVAKNIFKKSKLTCDVVDELITNGPSCRLTTCVQLSLKVLSARMASVVSADSVLPCCLGSV